MYYYHTNLPLCKSIGTSTSRVYYLEPTSLLIEHTANVEQLSQFILRISLARNEVEARQLLEQLGSDAQPES
ncbi:MAG: hypothetical protein J2P37_07980 [Ktedonobacteraceae bacterium]|nr:hypothetical protein [Ktedonobacteraceae bacterium]MBO0790136.1 hypothetical protein [Ktedonobacteraceae bacterium]